MSFCPALHYDPRLVEEAVFLARREGYVARELDEARSRIYEIADTDEREGRFGELNRFWFERLDLGKVVEEALREQTIVAEKISGCYLVRAAHRKEEGAELFVATDGERNLPAQRTVRVLLRSESFFEGEALRTFLRHEFFHIADMLDPAFAYEPTLPKAEGGPTYDTLIINRYRVLWDLTISGRMARRGWLDESTREGQLKDFLQGFPMLEENGEESFRCFYDGDHPCHAALAAFAFDPRGASGHGRSAAGTHCSLCRFPSHSFEPAPENLDREVLAAINRDFPGWTPADGLCLQCADLYRASRLSLAAARAIPGWVGATAAAR